MYYSVNTISFHIQFQMLDEHLKKIVYYGFHLGMAKKNTKYFVFVE